MEIVYVLTNPAMRGLVKIGCTTNEDANIRIGQLYTTGVPVPFTLEVACRVENAKEVERALHLAFGPDRINPQREFFSIDPEQAIAILRLLDTEDATREIIQQPSAVDAQSEVAAEELRSKRPRLNFEDMNIPVGAVLQSVHSDITVTVVGPKRVSLGEESMSLTKATRRVLSLDYDVRPTRHWTYLGRPLREIYNETYGAVD